MKPVSARFLFTVTASATFALSACGGADTLAGPTVSATGEISSSPLCYELVEADSRAVVKVESVPTANDPQGGQVTVYSYVSGQEEFSPETTAGRLEGDTFVYGDGTRLQLSDATLTWPKDSLLEGAVFTITTCP